MPIARAAHKANESGQMYICWPGRQKQAGAYAFQSHSRGAYLNPFHLVSWLANYLGSFQLSDQVTNVISRKMIPPE
jgi:hypothetical protein